MKNKFKVIFSIILVVLVFSSCTNNNILNDLVNLTILVVDDEENIIEGAKVELSLENGEDISSFVGDLGFISTTGTNGKVTFQVKKNMIYKVAVILVNQNSEIYENSIENIINIGENSSNEIEIILNRKNRAPVLSEIGDKAVNEGETLEFTISGNDVDGDSLSYSASGDKANYFDNSTQTFYWKTTFDDTGSYELTFSVSDGKESDSETITITVGDVNRSPIAADDSLTTDEDTAYNIDKATLMANDSDPDGDNLVFSSYSEATYGNITDNQDGTLTYTPDADYNGTDSFDYEISDGNGGIATASVTLTVNAVNDAPVFNDIDDQSVNENEKLIFTVDATDVEGDTLTYSATKELAEYFDEATKTFSWTPAYGDSGNYSITITVSDGELTDSITINISVGDVNRPPVAADDSLTTDEDTAYIIDKATLMANDSDPDGDSLVFNSNSEATYGNITDNQDGTLTYTPDVNYNGEDNFSYIISDGELTDTATVNITVNSVNDVPVAEDEDATVDEDSTILIDVLVNDSDIDGDTLSITGFTQGTNGTVAQEGDSLRYTPDADYNGADSFTYDISDGNGGVATATVNITVNPVNDLPVAVDDSGTVNEDSTILIDVLLNDSDIEGDTLAITGFTQGRNGVVAQEGDSLRYTPDADYNGADSFDYEISDGNGGIATASVTLTVNAVNDVPVAVDDSGTIDEDSTILIDVLVNDSDIDGDTLSITGFTQGTNGTVSQEGDSLRYTPDADYNGADSFDYEISDGNGGIATASVTLTVNAVNDFPMAVDDSGTLDEDSTILIDVLLNDSDIEGDTLSITGFTQGTNGVVAQEGDSLRYSPDADYNGADSFDYEISDGNGGVATATVSITINPMNDLPVAVNDSAEVDQNSAILIDVLANDNDPDGDIVSIFSFAQGINGTVLQEGNSLKYTPNAVFVGTDSFTYDISDGNGGIATAIVNVTTVLSMDIDEDTSHNNGYTQYYEINITESGNYNFVTSFYKESKDTVIYLYDSSKTEIASNDDYVDLYGAIMGQSLGPGTYYVRVQDFDMSYVICHLEVAPQ